MAKRAPILPEGYNPVGDALMRAVAKERAVSFGPQGDQNQGIQEQVELTTSSTKGVIEEVSKPVSSEVPSTGLMRRSAVDITSVPVGRELKQTSFRFRCTDNERRKWHGMSQELTGEHSQLSHIARAAFMLFEHAFDELLKRSSEIQSMRYPAKSDHLGQALYEQRIAGYLYEAIRAAGKPRS